MGYMKGVIHGAVLGTVLGLAIAPQEGARTREQMRLAAQRMRQGVDSAQATARRVAPQVRQAAETATDVVSSLRQRVAHGTEEDGFELSGSPAPDGSQAPLNSGIPI